MPFTTTIALLVICIESAGFTDMAWIDRETLPFDFRRGIRDRCAICGNLLLMTDFEALQQRLKDQRFTWLVTGGGGFIGSHLTDHLLQLGQKVVVLDNFSTGYKGNLDLVRANQASDPGDLLTLVDGDVRDLDLCRQACAGCDHILHQAALGSVPRSIDDPVSSHASNVTGTVNLFTAAKDAGIKRVVYASSSSVYGDEPNLPKVEERTGDLLSPYAATKAINETYASVFSRCYGLETVGLRYFNVFGPRQDPNGPYAAVIPKWIDEIARRTPPGDQW